MDPRDKALTDLVYHSVVGLIVQLIRHQPITEDAVRATLATITVALMDGTLVDDPPDDTSAATYRLAVQEAAGRAERALEKLLVLFP